MSSGVWFMTGLGLLCLGGTAAGIHPRVVERMTAANVLAGRAHGVPVPAPVSPRAHSPKLRRRDAPAALLTAVRLLSSELAAGARPADALAAAAAIDPHHRYVLDRAASVQRQGGNAAAVLRSEPAVAFLGHAWAVVAATGAAPAEVLARASSDCADRLELRRAVATALAGARASAAVMAALPLLGVSLGTAMGARPLPTLIGSPGGRLCAVLGVLLDAVGIGWTQWIARRAARQ